MRKIIIVGVAVATLVSGSSASAQGLQVSYPADASMDCAAVAAESARLRAAFRERFCEYDDGRAAERVVRAVMLGEPLPEPAGDPGLVPAQTAGRDLLTPS